MFYLATEVVVFWGARWYNFLKWPRNGPLHRTIPFNTTKFVLVFFFFLSGKQDYKKTKSALKATRLQAEAKKNSSGFRVRLAWTFISLSDYWSLYQHVSHYFCLPVCLSQAICDSACLSVCQPSSFHLSVYRPSCLRVCLTRSHLISQILDFHSTYNLL